MPPAASSLSTRWTCRVPPDRGRWRVVEHQQPGLRQQRCGQPEPLPHPEREAAHAVSATSVSPTRSAHHRSLRAVRRAAGERRAGSAAPSARDTARPVHEPATPAGERERPAHRDTPNSSRSPPSAWASPSSSASSVVFPAPLGPTRPCTCPGATSRSTPSSATTSPKDLTIPRARTASARVTSSTGAGDVLASSAGDGPPELRRAVVSDCCPALVRRLVSSSPSSGCRRREPSRAHRSSSPWVGTFQSCARTSVPVHLLRVGLVRAPHRCRQVLPGNPRLPGSGDRLIGRRDGVVASDLASAARAWPLVPSVSRPQAGGVVMPSVSGIWFGTALKGR